MSLRVISPSVVAIDSHVHLSDATAIQARSSATRAISKHFGKTERPIPVDEMADMYRERNMMALIMNSTDEWTTGGSPLRNDYVAEVVAAHPDCFLGCGAVDPRRGGAAAREVRRCAEELNLVAVGELNPARQHFYPNDRDCFVVWEAAQEVGLPVVLHGGYPAAGSGTRGGSNVRLKYARPIHLDDLAADFPDLRIVCAHPSWPWESEALAVAMHKPNVFIDLSGWAPKYLPPLFVTYMRSRLTSKFLFGTDWPGLSVERWLSEFAEFDLSDEVRQKVMLENAKECFGLTQVCE
jgi:predicted TIM-barrel fold metal-dependent hydrolase